jgi:hypothetical protein
MVDAVTIHGALERYPIPRRSAETDPDPDVRRVPQRWYRLRRTTWRRIRVPSTASRKNRGGWKLWDRGFSENFRTPGIQSIESRSDLSGPTRRSRGGEGCAGVVPAGGGWRPGRTSERDKHNQPGQVQKHSGAIKHALLSRVTRYLPRTKRYHTTRHDTKTTRHEKSPISFRAASRNPQSCGEGEGEGETG